MTPHNNALPELDQRSPEGEIVKLEGEDAGADELDLELDKRVKDYASSGVVERTRVAYRSDLRHLVAWCDSQGLDAMPLSVKNLCRYLAHLADEGFLCATIKRRIVSISKAHKMQGFKSPTSSDAVKLVWRGIRRRKGKPQDRKAPLLVDDLKLVVSRIDSDKLSDIRDRAILLIGWAAALRRSELAGLDFSDIKWHDRGLDLCLSRSKTDQEGMGQFVAVHAKSSSPFCPVEALRSWMQKTEITQGPVFRTLKGRRSLVDQPGRSELGGRLRGRSIARMIQRRIAQSGLNASKYGGHSLRSGLAVSAKMGGASETEILRVTRHRTLKGALPYFEVGDRWSSDPAGKAGL